VPILTDDIAPPTFRMSREPSLSAVAVKAATRDVSIIVNKLNNYIMVSDDG